MPHAPRRTALATALLALAIAPAASAADLTVPFYHGTPDHAGVFTVPGLTAETAPAVAPDAAFGGALNGVINAAPLYWHPDGATRGLVIVATEANIVTALDATSGLPVWSITLGTPAPRSGVCGNIVPAGVTGTPVIDKSTGTLFLDALIQAATGEQHQVFALSATTGAILPGWPIAPGAGVRALGQPFVDASQEQRGALALLGNRLFIAYGGYSGDCGPYHGVVAGIDRTTATPAVAAAWSTTADKGGIWAPGGIVSDGSTLYYATGNTASATSWGGGEAIVANGPALSHTNNPNFFFTPRDWLTLDDEDADLGGVAPALIDLQGATPARLIVALGKDGNAYLLDRDHLGGISHALQTLHVASRAIVGSTARTMLNSGDALIVARGTAQGCGTSGLFTVRVTTTGSGPRMKRGWCTPFTGRGDPIVTTTDGTHNPIAWVTGAEGDNALHAFAADDGRPLYTSAPLASTIAHFSTILIANHRLYIPAANHLYAFTLPGG